MLLELFVAHQGGRQVSVESLCHASGVPATTALRHLSLLEKHGLITRDGDAQDNRRWFIRPTQSDQRRRADGDRCWLRSETGWKSEGEVNWLIGILAAVGLLSCLPVWWRGHFAADFRSS